MTLFLNDMKEIADYADSRGLGEVIWESGDSASGVLAAGVGIREFGYQEVEDGGQGTDDRCQTTEGLDEKQLIEKGESSLFDG